MFCLPINVQTTRELHIWCTVNWHHSSKNFFKPKKAKKICPLPLCNNRFLKTTVECQVFERLIKSFFNKKNCLEILNKCNHPLHDIMRHHHKHNQATQVPKYITKFYKPDITFNNSVLQHKTKCVRIRIVSIKNNKSGSELQY